MGHHVLCCGAGDNAPRTMLSKGVGTFFFLGFFSSTKISSHTRNNARTRRALHWSLGNGAMTTPWTPSRALGGSGIASALFPRHRHTPTPRLERAHLHRHRRTSARNGDGAGAGNAQPHRECRTCRGSGWKPCGQCGGTGVNPSDVFGGRYVRGDPCWLCNGKAKTMCGDCVDMTDTF